MYRVSIKEPEHKNSIDLRALEAMQATAPKAHIVVGVLRRPPFFRRQTCGAKFSNKHPKLTDEDRNLPYWTEL